jgi:fibronectin type 3 domain-containing protein
MNRRIRRSSWASFFLLMFCVISMTCLTGCGENAADKPATTATGAASITLLVSNPQLDSDQKVVGAPTVTLTAIVKDGSNRALEGEKVSFSADSGVLEVTSGTTGADGKATATLGNGGNPTIRPIQVTAATGSVSTANTVTVTGTALSISGAASLSFGDSTPLTIFLKDSAGAGIAGKTITVTSLKGNTLDAASYMTNASGQVIVNVTAAVGGADKITAAAIGATKDFDLTVNTAILRFIDPPPVVVTEIPIETNRSVTVEYISGSAPLVGVTVNFFTTRGALSSSSATTGADGRATVTVSSANSGPALLVASIVSGPSSQVALEFVAPTVFSLDLKASPAVIGTNSGGLETEKSLITATVRDKNDNLVKNKTVSFTIVLDASAGRLSPASAITDSYGAAGTYFIAGASTGGLGGVTVRGSVMGTSVTATTTLTVAKKALFIALATGPTIKVLDPNKYLKEYVALVTDAAGNPVAGATVVATVTPVYYKKGYYTGLYNAAGTAFLRWQQVLTLDAASSTLPGISVCANEDTMLHNPLYDFNGVLDTNPLTGETEDVNGNGRLDPGNVASVTAAVTDSTGHGTLSIVYAMDYAYWVTVKLEAFANDLKGSTASAYATFDLPGEATDYTNEKVDPPGNPSPFGRSKSCYVDLTVTLLSTSQLALTWQKSPTANHYHVYRNGIFIANATQNTYTDTGLVSGTEYCYQIRSVDAAGTESSFTGKVCNSTFVLPPTGLTATALSPTQIRISWTASPGATGYNIYRDAGFIKSVASTSIVDSPLTADTTYCYAVSSINAAGEASDKSSQVCAMTRSAGPPVPTGLIATTNVTPLRVTLTWTTSLGAVRYNIYRDGTFLLGATGAQATDTAVAAQTNYCYTISAVDIGGNESAQSEPKCISTATAPAVPSLTATLVTLAGPAYRVDLIWTASSGAVSYRIYRNGSLFASPAVSPWSDTTVTAPQNLYCYTISAVDAALNESAQSAQSCVTTPP